MSESTGTSVKASKKNGKLVSLYDAYALDPKLCEEGRLLEFDGSDSWMKVKPAHPDYNPEYRDALDAELQRQLANGVAYEELDWNAIGIELAYVCIGSWGNMLDKRRKKMKFNRENAKALLDDIPTVKTSVAVTAHNLAEFRYKLDAGSLKN